MPLGVLHSITLELRNRDVIPLFLFNLLWYLAQNNNMHNIIIPVILGWNLAIHNLCNSVWNCSIFFFYQCFLLLYALCTIHPRFNIIQLHSNQTWQHSSSCLFSSPSRPSSPCLQHSNTCKCSPAVPRTHPNCCHYRLAFRISLLGTSNSNQAGGSGQLPEQNPLLPAMHGLAPACSLWISSKVGDWSSVSSNSLTPASAEQGVLQPGARTRWTSAAAAYY